ncbi:MAG: hypothetical protein CMK59_14335 [Proteobacteria bacterium]|nr:hypothetical protein [Pseudomonadota bacterium]
MLQISLNFVFIVTSLGCNEYDLNKVVANNPQSLRVTEDSEPLVCNSEAPESYGPEVLNNCKQEPIIGVFNPGVEWTWNTNPVNPSYNVVETAPIAINLNDDNEDGLINDQDIPDVIFPAFRGNRYGGEGHLIALSGDTHLPLFVAYYEDYPFWGISGIATADVDRDGLPDIFAATETGLMRLSNEGDMIWHTNAHTSNKGHSIVSIADLDADGLAEIILNGGVFSSDGTLLWEAADNDSSNKDYFSSFAADLDMDGVQEVISNGTVFEHDGSIRWSIPDLKGYPAIGDLDGDLQPEIISTYNGMISVVNKYGDIMWRVEHGRRSGPPTIADFDGDGAAEIGVASKEDYSVWDNDGTLLWSNPIQETSSGRTGSSVFDFEGDGAAEVVYADEETLWVFDGATGTVEMEWTQHSSGTRFEYPTIVDIDADGSAEILLAGGRDANFGLTVIGSLDNSWAAARSIWNQYAYSITNINDDGTIPLQPEPNWLYWNNFRAGNSETKVGLDLADLHIGNPSVCLNMCEQGLIETYFPIENRGLQDINQDISIYIQTSNGSQITEPIPFLGYESTHWIGPYTFTKEEISDGIFVSVDTQNGINECFEDNNALLWSEVLCVE